MTDFLKEIVKWKKFELIIDNSIFNKEIVLKTAYLFLDKWYFFFKEGWKKEIILQFTLKDWVKVKLEDIISEFSDELLNNSLREVVSKENKEIRSEIIQSAIQNSLRASELPNEWNWYDETTGEYFKNDEDNGWDQIDFDKDIDDILKEIENDPELKIDEDEIEKILKEIEEESEEEEKGDKEIKLDVDAAKAAKKNFKKK